MEKLNMQTTDVVDENIKRNIFLYFAYIPT
jgi:hypothetical protein